MEGGSESPQSSEGGGRLGTMTTSAQEGDGLGEVRLSVESFEIDKTAVKAAKGVGARELLERVPEARRIRVEFSDVRAWVPLLEVDGGAVTKVRKSLARQISLAKGEDLPPTKKQVKARAVLGVLVGILKLRISRPGRSCFLCVLQEACRLVVAC